MKQRRTILLASLTLVVAPLPLSCGGDGTDQGIVADQGTGTSPAMESGGATSSASGSGGRSGTGGVLGADPSGAGGAGASTQGAGGSPSSDSEDALTMLRSWLVLDAAERPAIETQTFSTTPLTGPDAATAKDLLWNDLSHQIRMSRSEEVEQKAITINGLTLAYETVLLGDEPPDGRSLFISMHGGGNAPKETNDQQWQNQIALAESYAPQNTLWIAPRAPIDDWNMWFTSDIPPLFDRLITNMIVFEGVNPDRVYLTGYSAGGDGVYQLGPTMADRWAGAAMSAGHPNDMTPTNLRNLAFAIHVGGDDTAYDRNLVAAQWGQQLDTLMEADPGGYPHQVEVHPGLPHWMNLADQPSVPFIQSFERDVYPDRVVWRQSTLLQTRFYFLEVEPAQAVKDAEITANITEQTIALSGEDLDSVTLLLSDAMLDLDQDVTVLWGETTAFSGLVPRTILDLHGTLAQREDPAAAFSGSLRVTR